MNNKTIIAEKKDENTVLANNDITVLAKEPNDNETIIASDVTKLANNSLKENEIVNDDIVSGDVINGYKIGNIINENSGESFIRLCKKDDSEFVIKIYKKGREINNDLENKLVELSRGCSIVPILDKGIFKQRYYEIVPYYKNGTLYDNRDKITDDFLKNVVVPQMNETLHFLHSNNIFHNDIKPSNIFISEDWNHIYLGDFGISSLTNGRDVITNLGNFSRGYAAPEASRINNSKTDYYSFGVTLLVLSHGNPFSGVAELEKELLIHGVSFTDEMNSDISDLIFLLSQYDPNNRIGYEDVKKWCDDSSCFRGARKKITNNYFRELPINEYKFFDENNNKVSYFDGLKLADALSKNIPQALKHYKAGFLLDIYEAADQELGLKLKKIVDENQNNIDLGLMLFLKEIKPTLPFLYKGMNVSSISEYVDYLLKNYLTIDINLLDDRIINSLLSNVALEDPMKRVWDQILYEKDPEKRLDFICDAFRTDSTFYCNRETFKSFGCYLDEYAFNSRGDLSVLQVMRYDSAWLLRIILKQDFGEDKDAVINSILNDGNETSRVFKTTKLYLGYLPYCYMGKKIKNLFDLVSLAGEKINDNDQKAIAQLDELIASEVFSLICANETDFPSDLIEKIKSTEHKALALYYFGSENPTYLHFSTSKEIAKMILKKKSLEKNCVSLWEDPAFQFWLLSRGVQK